MGIKWVDLKEILSSERIITTDTELGCYENFNKYMVPGKYDNYTVKELTAIRDSIHVKLVQKGDQ